MSKEEQPRSAQAVLIEIPVDHYHSLLDDDIGGTSDSTSNSNKGGEKGEEDEGGERESVQVWIVNTRTLIGCLHVR